jgi:hypothetical protein
MPNKFLPSHTVYFPQLVSKIARAALIYATAVAAIARRAFSPDEPDELLLRQPPDVGWNRWTDEYPGGWIAPPERTARNPAPCTRSCQCAIGT